MLVSRNFADIVTFARASSASVTDSTGTRQNLGNNLPRLSYDPSTLIARGLLIEGTRTNSIRNNTMQGAVAGSPGTRPTNWAVGWVTTASGLSFSIAGVGTEAGVPYVDVLIAGTSNTTGVIALDYESASQIAAATGQTWSLSQYVRVVSGALGTLKLFSRISERDSGGTNLSSGVGAQFSSVGGSLQRFNQVATLASASTAFVLPGFVVQGDGVSTYNVTIRIGLPQLEKLASASEGQSSAIYTTTAAATRAEESATFSVAGLVSSQNTLLVQAYSPNNSADGVVVVELNDGTANNCLRICRVSGRARAQAVVAGATVCDIDAGAWANDTLAKIAFRAKAGSYAASLNGAAVVTSAGATVPTVTGGRIGNNLGGTSAWNSAIGNIQIIPSGKTDSELVTLAT